MKPLTAEEKHARATSKGLKRSARKRQCPSCRRKAALTLAGDGGRRCRWCGYTIEMRR